MIQSTRHLRVFISSPGDVAQERHIAWDVLDALPDRPVFRDRVSIRVIAWDKPGSDTPMLAKLTPQEAINLGHPTPDKCDIVVVILWSRMGTPFVLDGKEYLSGTQWEYLNAIESDQTEVIVYRRTEKVEIALDDPLFESKREQYERINAFFATFSDPETGQARRGVNLYETPEDFRQKFETHLEALVQRLLLRAESTELDRDDANAEGTVASKVWQGSPFPGLRAFTDVDAPIFFGRGHEIDALVKRLQTTRFVGIVGVSGSGKSSLVGAGLIPQLKANAVVGSKDWLLPTWNQDVNQWVGLRFTPGEVGDNPFMALALKLVPYLGPSADSAPVIAKRLAEQPVSISNYLDTVLTSKPDWAEALMFIDQLEELFNVVQPELRAPFVQMLSHLALTDARVHIVATLRVDFYGTAIADPALALLFANHHPLPAPPLGALYEMITRPAERAAIRFEEGLADQILADTGGEPGALALMAYLLDELYQASNNDHVLTFEKYHALGGVQGAIAQRAEKVLSEQPPEARAALLPVFHNLVQMDDRGTVTRRRAPRSEVTTSAAEKTLVDAFVAARLLVTSSGQGNQPMVEVAHEALLTNWPLLRQELDADREFLLWRQQLRRDVQIWQRNRQDSSYLYSGARLIVAEHWREQRAERLAADDLEFLKASVSQRKRRRAVRTSFGVILAVLFVISAPFVSISVYNEILRQQTLAGAPMVEFAGATALLGLTNEAIFVPAYSLDRFEVSTAQYNRCVAARACSQIFAPTYDPPSDDNMPVTSVNAFQSAQFCHWLGRDLPTSAELERAARGTDGRPFPWGGEATPDPSFVNAYIEGDPQRFPTGTVPVNDPRYTLGSTPEGIMHLLGNVQEWTVTPAGCGSACTERWDETQSMGLELRGGGWASAHLTPDTWDTAITEAQAWEASQGDIDIGFRCAQPKEGESIQ